MVYLYSMYIDGTGYKIFIEKDSFENLKEYLASKAKGKSLFVLTDSNIEQSCLPLVQPLLETCGPVKKLVIPPGEQAKNMDTVMECCKFLSSHQANRDTLLICLGGGVITDLGGFTASIYKRGIDTILLPTTLLAQIDASVGGKTGIDAFGLKNMIGTFSMPSGVFVQPLFLKTLEKRQIKAGFAEALKHGLIENKGYWNYLKEFDFENYDRMIFKSIEIKDKLVDRDPHESGERKKLNFGHTIGHAIESYFLAQGPDLVLHGEAVAAGMICEAWISTQMQGLKEEELNEIVMELKRHFTRIPLPEDAYPKLKEFMLNDKKNVQTQISFTLLGAIGESYFNRTVEEELILHSLEYYRQHA